MRQDAPSLRLANLVITASAVCCFLVMAYFVYMYHWTGSRSFTSWLGPVLYYVVPFLTGCGLLACLKMNSTRRINVSVCLFSMVVSIYAVEAALTVWFSLPSVNSEQSLQVRIRTAQRLRVPYDPRPRAKVIQDLRRENIDAVPSVFPQALLYSGPHQSLESRIRVEGSEILPLAGISNHVTVVCNEGGRFLIYPSDEHGFHNPMGSWQGKHDVVALGDSFTQGWCVDTPDNFVSQIRKSYPATLNLGIEGDGPLTMLATLKEYAQPLQPKTVLWFFYEGNDLADLKMEWQSPLLRRYLTSPITQNLIHRQDDIDQAIESYLVHLTRSRFTATFNEVVTNVRRFNRGTFQNIAGLSEFRRRLGLIQGTDAPSEEDFAAQVERRARQNKGTINTFRDILLESKRVVEQWNGQIYFVYLPSRTRYEPSVRDRIPDRDAVLEMVRSLGLPLIDIHQAFEKQQDPMGLFPLRLASHYNEEGHRIVADEVVRRLGNGSKEHAPLMDSAELRR